MRIAFSLKTLGVRPEAIFERVLMAMVYSAATMGSIYRTKSLTPEIAQSIEIPLKYRVSIKQASTFRFTALTLTSICDKSQVALLNVLLCCIKVYADLQLSG